MKALKALPLAAALLLGVSGMASSQTGGTSGAGIGASGLTGSNAGAVASPTPSTGTSTDSTTTGTRAPVTSGTGQTVPGTGTTGPAATSSSGGSAASMPCPSGTVADGVGDTRRCRPLAGSGGDTTGIAAPSSIMAPPVAPGGTAR